MELRYFCLIVANVYSFSTCQVCFRRNSRSPRSLVDTVTEEFDISLSADLCGLYPQDLYVWISLFAVYFLIKIYFFFKLVYVKKRVLSALSLTSLQNSFWWISDSVFHATNTCSCIFWVIKSLNYLTWSNYLFANIITIPDFLCVQKQIKPFKKFVYFISLGCVPCLES